MVGSDHAELLSEVWLERRIPPALSFAKSFSAKLDTRAFVESSLARALVLVRFTLSKEVLKRCMRDQRKGNIDFGDS